MVTFAEGSPVIKSAVFQVMAGWLIGDKPLTEPVMTKSHDAIWNRKDLMS